MTKNINVENEIVFINAVRYSDSPEYAGLVRDIVYSTSVPVYVLISDARSVRTDLLDIFDHVLVREKSFQDW